MIVHAFNSHTQEAKAGRSPWVRDQPDFSGKVQKSQSSTVTLSQHLENKTKQQAKVRFREMEADSWSWPLASVCTCRHMHACICAHVYTYTGTHTCAIPKKIKLKFLKEKNLHENAPKKVFISLLFQKGTGRWHQKGGSQRSTLSGLHLNPWQPCCLEENVKNSDMFFYLREILRSPMQWHSGGWLWTHEERCSKIHTGSLMLKHANLFHQWARQLLFLCV